MAAFLALGLCFVYLFFIAILNSSWVKDKITAKLKLKSNSDWTVGFISWIPYKGIKVNNIESLMGVGGVKINALSIDVSLEDILSQSLASAEITAQDIEVDIDIVWLKEQFTSDNIINNHPEYNIVDSKSTSNASLNIEPKPSNQVDQRIKEPSKRIKVLKPQQKTKINVIQHTESKKPNRWFRIKNAKISLRNGTNILSCIEHFDAAIPISGKPAKGHMSCIILGSSFKQQVVWNGLGLKIVDESANFAGVNYAWQLNCNINTAGIPFSLKLSIPDQYAHFKFDRPNMHMQMISDLIGANLIVKGGLIHTNTWRGFLNIRSINTKISENQKTNKSIHFSDTRLVASLQNGSINIPSLEAIGHDVSVIANGVVNKNTYIYGVVRLICTEETRDFFEGVYHATKLINIDESSYHLLGPLDNPDRKYCDVYVDGKIDQLEIRHNRSNTWQSLNKTLNTLLLFKNEELEEDGLLEDED